MMRRRWLLFFMNGILLVVGAMFAWLVLGAGEVAAQDDETDAPPQPSSAYCLLCHAQPGRTWELPSGEILSLSVDPTLLQQSVHGENNPEGALQCVDCHIGQRFPHQTPASQTTREFKLERYASCRTCHEDQYTHAQDSVHGQAVRAGEIQAAVCVDCHGGHNIQPPDEPRQRISFTCGSCHGAIFDQYRDSIHGAALLDESNPDVPTCIDCHGVHNIQNPLTSEFRVNSPQICAKCHADDNLMAKYDISTSVFNSYLTDFHGSTVALFEQQNPDVATNKAVCFDCHGVHDIAAVSDENSHVIRQNLLSTCQQCHPDATTDFPDAWLGHFPPTLQTHPLMFLVDLFYKILIPGTIGVFVLLIATDVFRRIRGRLGSRQH